MPSFRRGPESKLTLAATPFPAAIPPSATQYTARRKTTPKPSSAFFYGAYAMVSSQIGLVHARLPSCWRTRR